MTLTSYEAGHPYLLALKSLEKNKPFDRHSHLTINRYSKILHQC
jgi:hypothetical protein